MIDKFCFFVFFSPPSKQEGLLSEVEPALGLRVG